MPGPLELKVESGGETLVVRGNEVLDPRAGLIIAPGFAEYAGRYSRLAQELASRGYSVFSYDPRGHGGSSGHRGHTPSWRRLVTDLDNVITALDEERLLPRRRGLVGVSMGGLVALDWALEHRGRVNGLVLVGPFFEAAFAPPPWKVGMAHALGTVLPFVGVAHGLKGKDMSTDIAVAAQYDEDPRITRVMSPKYYFSYREAQRRLRASGPSVDFPVLVQHGAADPIASVEAAVRWARSVPDNHCEWTVYTGMKHEVLNEMDRRRVVSDLVYWLDRRLLEHDRPGP